MVPGLQSLVSIKEDLKGFDVLRDNAEFVITHRWEISGITGWQNTYAARVQTD